MPSNADTRSDTLTWGSSPIITFYALLFTVFWLYTGFTTTDLNTWLLENTLTIPAVILIYYLYRWHPFSNWSLTLILLFMLLHVYGSQHTYAENPFGYWLQETFNFGRNHFDRVVHFSFGLLLAYPMQELLANKTRFPRWFTLLLPLELTLSLGAVYELAEWLVADTFFPGQADQFLGMQGDSWDAQKDLAVALLGAAMAMASVTLFRPRQT